LTHIDADEITEIIPAVYLSLVQDGMRPPLVILSRKLTRGDRLKCGRISLGYMKHPIVFENDKLPPGGAD
jgi:hypothetical protein